MDEIIQIVVFVGIMVAAVVQQVVKTKKNSPTAPLKDVLEDVFPELDQEQVTVSPKPVGETNAIRNPKRNSVPRQKTQTSDPLYKQVGTSSDTPTGKIRLNSREEAKKAFIYSEIFNRKY